MREPYEEGRQFLDSVEWFLERIPDWSPNERRYAWRLAGIGFKGVDRLQGDSESQRVERMLRFSTHRSLGMPEAFGNIQVRRTWTDPATSRECSFELDFPAERLNHFRRLNWALSGGEHGEGSFMAYPSFWVWRGGHKEIGQLVSLLGDKFRGLTGTAREAAPFQFASFIKGFVGSIPYRHDCESLGWTEYGRFPLEMLADGCGDCECHSLLLASLFVHAGLHAVLVSSVGHMAVGLLPQQDFQDAAGLIEVLGTRLLFCESTNTSPIGEVPEHATDMRTIELAASHDAEYPCPPPRDCECGLQRDLPADVDACPQCGRPATFGVAAT